MTEDYKRKRIRINSNMKSAQTQDTTEKELSVSKDDWWLAITSVDLLSSSQILPYLIKIE